MSPLDVANSAAEARSGHIEASHAARTRIQYGVTADILANRETFDLMEHLAGLRKMPGVTPAVVDGLAELQAKMDKVIERSNYLEAQAAALTSENAALKAKLGA
jgi:hypothetical protein